MKAQRATICFCTVKDHVLLARKRRGYGVRLLNGYGGKFEKGESSRQNAIREIFQESGMIVLGKDLRKVAVVQFMIDGKRTFKCDIYVFSDWRGQPHDTEEMVDPRWFPIDRLPFAEMWSTAPCWYHLALREVHFEATINASSCGTLLNVAITAANFSKENKS